METPQIFKNLRVVTPREIIECDIEVENGKIKKIKRNIQEKGIDLEKRLALQNVTDLHVHTRDFREREKETVESCTKAALAGGITRIVDMPNTNPPILTKKIYEERLKLFEEYSNCDFRVNMGAVRITPKIEKVFKSYTPPFLKIYLSKTTGHLTFNDDLEKLFSLKIPIAVHADFENMKRCVELSKKYNTKLHICHISQKKELEYLIVNKDKNITSEITPHHLLLTRKNHERLKPETFVKPELSSERDRIFLLKNLKYIDVIASDHAPHILYQKKRDAFGISGIETMLPLMLDCVNKGLLNIFELSEKLSQNPCRILGDNSFSLNSPANFTLIDLKRENKIDSLKFLSKAKHSPFHGFKVRGCVEKVFLHGRIVFENDVGIIT
ncbi:MAG: amidohydrolase family protein [Candidatus Methanofastidiosia archaeon]